MTDTSYKDTSLFNRLKRLFSSDVIIRNQGRGELKVLDINKIQRSGKYQTNALIDRFSRLYVWNNRNVFNPTLNFQTLRIQLYSDYESMDTDAIISSVLDTVADECTLKNDRGEILSIVSSDENIKVALENLFYDVLNINFNLWAWIRSMLKYGDFFLKLEISEKFGVYNVLPYSVYHMSRVEGSDPNNPTKVVFHLDPDGQATSQDPNYVPKNSKSVIELQNYEVAHFRLLTDSNYLPYGRSYIEPARKIFKQLTLCLPGTTIVWVPGGYKKLQDIETGDPIYSFDYKTNTFVESKVTGKIQTGIKPTYKVWTKHRCLEAAATHPVMVQGGSYKTVADLTTDDRIVLGSNLELQDLGKLPDFNLDASKVKACLSEEGLKVFATAKRKCLICGEELKANNHKHFETHGFTSQEYFDKFNINRNELGSFSRGRGAKWISYEKARHYCKLYGVDEKYLQISTSGNSKSFVDSADILRTSKMFVRFFGFMLGDGWTDRDSLCFSLGNRRDKSDKFVQYLRNDLHVSVSICKEGSTRAYAACSSQWLSWLFNQLGWKTGCKNKVVPEWVWELSKEHKLEFLKGFSDADGTFDPESGRWSLCGINKNLLESCFVLAQQVGLSTTNFSIHKGGYKGYWGNIVNDLYGFGYSEKHYHSIEEESGVFVEKIIKIEKVSDETEVFDISVESDLSNFVADGVVVHNCEDAALIHRIMRAPEKRIFYINVGQIPPNEVEQFMQKSINNIKKTPYVGPDGQYNLRFNMQNMMEDFYIPVRGGDTSTRIETTPGLNYDGINDVRYYQEKLFAALKVPKAFMGFEKDLSGKATLSAEDIKFARTVERIQKIIEAELTNIALVHLYALGFTGESLANFSINLTTPSIIFEQEKIALLKEKVDLASQMLDLKLFSSDYIYENIFGMSEDDYVQERDLVREDSKREFRLSQIESEGNDPAQSGRSYGTPHDLASMYGRRSTPAPKGASVGEVPAGYEEPARPVKDKHRTLNRPGSDPEGGRPRIRPSFYGTQNNPAGGADPTGRYNMHQPYKSDVEYVNETFVEPKQLVSFEDTKKSDNIYKGTLLDESIVDESTEKVERIINRRYDRLQGLSEKLGTEKEVL